MTRFISLLSLSLIALALPQIAAAQSVTLDPGLYDTSVSFIAGGALMTSDESEYCVKDGENSKTFDELVAEVSGEGQCTISNVSMTRSTGTADFACTETSIGFDVAGSMEANFGPDFYNLDARSEVPFMGEILVKTKIRRRGECAVSSSPSGIHGLD